MMNLRLISPLFLLISFFVYAQENQIPVNEKTGKAEYSEVVDVAGASAGDLYERADVWINDYFSNPSKVVVTRDSAIRIEGKHQFRLELTDKRGNKSPAGFVTYHFTLEFKDGKFRYVIYDINEKKASEFDITKWEDKDDPTYNEERYTQFIEQTITFFETWIDSLYETMSTPIEEESSDW